MSEIRSAFYNAPRLPLLYSGDNDLQHAIYDAVQAGLISIVDGAGVAVAVTAPTQVNLASTGLRLAKPFVRCSVCGATEEDHNCAHVAAGGLGGTPSTTAPHPVASVQTASEGTRRGTAASTQPVEDESPPAEKQLAFSFTSNLLNQDETADSFAALFRSLYLALDERQISYLQGTLQLIVDGDAAGLVTERASELGLNVTVRDM